MGKWTSEFSYQISTATEKEETGQFVVFEVQHWVMIEHSQHIEGLVQDCSNSSALAMELLQSCTKP